MAGIRPTSTTEIPIQHAEDNADIFSDPAGANFNDQSWDVAEIFGEDAAQEVRSFEEEVGISGAMERLRRPARPEEDPSPMGRVPAIPAAPARPTAPADSARRADRKTLGPWNFQGGLAGLATDLELGASEEPADEQEALKTQGPWSVRADPRQAPSKVTAPMPMARARAQQTLREPQDDFTKTVSGAPNARGAASRKTMMGLPTAQAMASPEDAHAIAQARRRNTLIGAPTPFEKPEPAMEEPSKEPGLSRMGRGSFFPNHTQPEHPAVIARTPSAPQAPEPESASVPKAGLFKVPRKRKGRKASDGPPPPRRSRGVGQYVLRGQGSEQVIPEGQADAAPVPSAEELLAQPSATTTAPLERNAALPERNAAALRTLNLASAMEQARAQPEPAPAPAPEPAAAPAVDNDATDISAAFALEDPPQEDPLELDEFEISAFSGGGYQGEEPQEPEEDGRATVRDFPQFEPAAHEESWPGAPDPALDHTYPMGVEAAEALARAAQSAPSKRPVRTETMDADPARPIGRPTQVDPEPATGQDWPEAPRKAPATESAYPEVAARGPETDVISQRPPRQPQVLVSPQPSSAQPSEAMAPPPPASDAPLRIGAGLAGVAMLAGAGLLVASMGTDAALALDEVSLLALAFPVVGALVTLMAAVLRLPSTMRAMIVALVGLIGVMLLSTASFLPAAAVGDSSRRLLMVLCLLLTAGLFWRARGQGSVASRGVVLLGLILVALNVAVLGVGAMPTGSALESSLALLSSGEGLSLALGALGLAPLALALPSLSALLGGPSKLSGLWLALWLAWLPLVCAVAGLALPESGASLLAWLGLGGLSFALALATSAGLGEMFARMVGDIKKG